MLYIIYICVYIHIYYLFIYLGFSFTIVLYVCYLLWNYFMCILLYMIMCMLLSATSTHSKWELMLYCLHCPTLNKVFLLLLFLLLLSTLVSHDKDTSCGYRNPDYKPKMGSPRSQVYNGKTYAN